MLTLNCQIEFFGLHVNHLKNFIRVWYSSCMWLIVEMGIIRVWYSSCNNSSIFSAEARWILLALDMIHWSISSHLFLSDSLSCLQSLQNRDLSRPLIAEILCRAHGPISDGYSVVFMWVPGYVGLAGNSAADSAAKAALLLAVSSLIVPYSDYRSLIRIQALRQWQLRWNSETESKLHSIEPRVNVINMLRLPRRDEFIIHRLRIERTYLTHGHLLRGETPSVFGLSSGFGCWACLASLCFLYKCSW